jgi:HEPN domain-containing protein
MDNRWCTETPYELFDKAEADVIVINSFIKDKDIPDNWKYDQICFHTVQAVEKFLKGFIIHNNYRIEKTHNLEHIWKVAVSIDVTFNNVQAECLVLNDYTSSVRYNSHTPIETQEFISVIKALKVVYFFLPIQQMRDEFCKQKGYRKLSNTELFASF